LDTAHGFSLRLRIRRVAPLADVRAINSGWKMRLGCEMVMEWAGLIHSTCSELQVNAKCLKYAKRKSAECAGGELNAELLTQVWLILFLQTNIFLNSNLSKLRSDTIIFQKFVNPTIILEY